MTARAPFEAKYATVCSECEQGILPGQQIEAKEWEYGYVHVTCPPTKHAEVCPRCFIEKAVSGDCGCSE